LNTARGARPQNFLGVSFNYHDAAACLVRDGIPIAAAEEERFSRRKHDARFPGAAISFCLAQAGLRAGDLDGIAFYEKPARKLERALSMAKIFSPRSDAHIAAQFPPLIEGGVNVEATIREHLGYAGPVYFCQHHLSHAASAFYASPFEEAEILTVDGVGEWATCAQYTGAGSVIEPLREIHYPHSLGLLYSTLTAFLGFTVNDDEYKIMGLASYGQPSYRKEMQMLLRQAEDGSFALALPYFAFMYDNKTMYTDKLSELLGKPRHRHEPVESRHQDIAASLQSVLEDAMVRLAQACRRGPRSTNLCLAGGVAYNCAANSRIAAQSGFERLFIQPAAGDDGAAMGAALWASYAVHGQARAPRRRHDTLLGPAFRESEILSAIQEFGLPHEQLDDDLLCRRVATLIYREMVVGWFQGRMEFGPRALGARSILANPRNPEMKNILNAQVKLREEFRPFAPAVTEEAAADYFELKEFSPFMLMIAPVRSERMTEIPCVTHVDGTARVQTVSLAHQPLFHKLIKRFGEISGTPVLINTSFNVRGEPIVCTPADAMRCFLGTDIDFLAIGPFLVSKV
jgi:carbamoyltransferase